MRAYFEYGVMTLKRKPVAPGRIVSEMALVKRYSNNGGSIKFFALFGACMLGSAIFNRHGTSFAMAILFATLTGLVAITIVGVLFSMRWKVYLFKLGAEKEGWLVPVAAKILRREPDRVALFAGRVHWDTGPLSSVDLGIRQYSDLVKALYSRDDLITEAANMVRHADTRSELELDQATLLKHYGTMSSVVWPSGGVVGLVELAEAMAGDKRRGEVLASGLNSVAELAEEFGGDEASWAMVVSFVTTCNKAENTGMSFEILGRYSKVAATVRGLNRVTAGS
jgi:hypothetical protein